MAEISNLSELRVKGMTIVRDVIDRELLLDFVLPFVFDRFIDDNPPNIWQTEWTTHPLLMQLQSLPSIRTVLHSFLGDHLVFPDKVQVAVVYPQAEAPPDSEIRQPPGTHFDGMFTDGECGDPMSLHHFSLLLGIILTGSDEPLRGNFGISPASHILLQDSFQKLSWIKRDKKSEEDFTEELLSLTHSVVRKSLPKLQPFEYVIGTPGDVFISHYQSLHATCANLGDEPRVVLYFRIHSNLEKDYQQDLRDLFSRIPSLTVVKG